MDSKLTPLGRTASLLPLPPHQAVALCKASSSGCAKQIAQIISMCSVDTVYNIPSTRNPEGRKSALKMVDKLAHPYGEHITLFFIWIDFEEQHGMTCRGDKKCTKPVSWHKELAAWCELQSLDCNALLKVQAFYWELKQSILKRNVNLELTSVSDPDADETPEILLRALLEGYFIKLAVKNGDYGDYLTFAEANLGHVQPETSFAFASEDQSRRGEASVIVMYDDFSVMGPHQYFIAASGINSQWIFESVSPHSRLSSPSIL